MKTNLHPRNLHRQPYDFDKLSEAVPDLKSLIKKINDRQTIDFADPKAVLLLNKALLKACYHINWDLPSDYLTPGIPGRADYIHHIADLLSADSEKIPTGNQIVGLDIGTGANMIYPILGNAIYQWNFVASDIDQHAIQNCVKLIKSNAHLANSIELQLQDSPRNIFKNIIMPQDRFNFTICNPPFHASANDANDAASRKVNNLSQTKTLKADLNFGGKNNELWCDGGELKFVTQMIFESKHYQKQVGWFTTLVSKASHIKSLEKVLAKVGTLNHKWIHMSQGNKQSRILAWRFAAAF
ncbi:MAG: 23S rRNA (adenine(1618)-N(6))-methyltransferase RlmF [Flavobacterium sp.]|nr:23S rRNA (adenine(1618)-N(6))-methyltransferase RlmF [Flavobacterium sp.]